MSFHCIQWHFNPRVWSGRVWSEFSLYRCKITILFVNDKDRRFGRTVRYGAATGSPLVIEVEDTEDSKPKDGRR